MIGIGATVLVHALLFRSLTLGSVATQRNLDETGPGSSAILSSDGSWMSLVIVHLPGPSESRIAEDVSSRGDAAANPIIQIVSPDPSPPALIEESLSDESGETAHTAGDPAMQSMLFGRYTGQIDARIKRAWRKPRSPINEEFNVGGAADRQTFRCQARIRQDDTGNVQEIELMQCNGSPAWKLSLVRAIQRASPLPAPPHPTVFTNTLTLGFEGWPYIPGHRDDEYEQASSSE